MRFIKPGCRVGAMGGVALLLLSAVGGGISGAAAQTLTTLHSFTGSPSDGSSPRAGLIADAAGNLYGTTVSGGSSCGGSGCGTVFKVTPTGSEIVLYSFTGGSDGANPYAGLIADAAGNLYGTTVSGGSSCGGSGCGTVFKVTPTGSEIVLYSFTGGSGDGANPFFAGLIADMSGKLYGTTAEGGVFGCSSIVFNGSRCGTVFKVTPTVTPPWTESVLYSFTGGNDGASPTAGLIADAAGNLYGTTYGGGAAACGNIGCGTVFEVTPTGTETVLHSFTGSDGANPQAGLIADMSGNVYGTTSAGANGYGTVFKLTVPVTFNGVPGQPNCSGQSTSSLAKKYGGIAHAATALGYASVADLQNAVAAYCSG